MRVAVLGAGYAGLTLARQLERTLPEAVDLVVVDQSDDHVLQHEIHRVVRRPSLADDLRIDLDDVLARADRLRSRVTDVDPDAGVAELADGRVDYDYAAVCLGSETAFYGLSGVEEHATPLKRIEHAETIRDRFLTVAADAHAGADPAGHAAGDTSAHIDGEDTDSDEASTGDAATDDPATVVVGGAGLSGIQLAGELAALAREQTVADAVEVVLLEQEAAVAPAFPANFQRSVRDALEARDVTVRTGTTVESADESTVRLAGSGELHYDQFVWTGGIRGPAPLDDERPVVRNTLRIGDGTFVLGDAGRVVDTDGEAVPASAQAAVREARVAATNLARLVEHDLADGSGFEPRLEGYTFDSPGWLVSVGDGAVAQLGPTVLTGPPARALKTSVGAGYLTSVGAVRNALDLVREELGWPGPDPTVDPDSDAEPRQEPIAVDVDEDASGTTDRD